MESATAVPPSGYPAAYESMIRLDDGRVVRIRPIRPTDAPELADAIRDADAETLRSRFLGAAPPLTDATLDRLTRLDYVDKFALVAEGDSGGVAVARYAVLPTTAGGARAAEVAVAVAPPWRHVGLATALVRLLARRAQECGISQFEALYSATNRPVAELAHLGRSHVVITDGTAELDAVLPRPSAVPAPPPAADGQT